MYLHSFLLPPITVHLIRLPLLLKHCRRIMFPHFLCYLLLWAGCFLLWRVTRCIFLAGSIPRCRKETDACEPGSTRLRKKCGEVSSSDTKNVRWEVDV